MSDEFSIQIYPSKSLVITTDKLKQNIFNRTKFSTRRNIIEDKRKEKTITPLNINFPTTFNEKNNLSAFDELVFDICISEQFNGNMFTTPAIIHRAYGGSKTNFTANEKDKIMHSIRILRSTDIDFDMSDICKLFGYNSGKQFKYSGSLLPSESITATVNGQTDSAVIHFLRSSPLLDVAKLKNQFTTCDIALLDIPNIKNTETVLSIKGYLLRRVLQIIGSHLPHKKHFAGKKKDGGVAFRQAKILEPTILLDSLFEQCDLSNAPKNRKAEYRKTIEKIMEHFKAKKLLHDFSFAKEDGKFRAISLDL